MGVENPYKVLPYMNTHIPRGSTFSQSVSLWNPSKTRKIRVFRVVPSDPQLQVHISAPSEIGRVSPFPSWQSGSCPSSLPRLSSRSAWLRAAGAAPRISSCVVAWRAHWKGTISVVLDVATLTIPVELFGDSGIVQTRPKSLFLGYLPQCPLAAPRLFVDAETARDLEVLNSNPTPLVVESVHIQVHDGGLSSGAEASLLPVHAVANTTIRAFQYATVLHIAFASTLPGNYSGVVTIHLNGTQPLVVPYAYTWASPRGVTRRVVEGAVVAPSPLFFCLKPSVRSKILPIPLRLRNEYPVPIAVTRVGIADSAMPYITVSDQWNGTRFTVGEEGVDDAQMNHTVACAAAAHRPFTPLYVLFHVARYRPRM